MVERKQNDKEKLKSEIQRIVRTPKRTPFELAQKLATLKRRWRQDFNKLVNASKTQKTALGPRRIHYLVSITEMLPSPEEYPGLEAIGWTKLALIAEHLKAKDIKNPKTATDTKELLDKAGGMSVRKLKAELSGEALTSKERCVMMFFSEQDYAHLEEVLLAHGATRSGNHGLRGKEIALMTAIQRL